MKRQASQLSLILAAIAFAPAALAGSEIVKCVDQAGHVTLTDQPCSAGASTVRLASSMPAAAEPAPVADIAGPAEPDQTTDAGPHPLAVERHAAVPGVLRPHGWKKPPAVRSSPLARDVATLKAARLQLLVLDGASRRHPRLAGLN